MKPIMVINDKQKKEDVKIKLEGTGYGFTVAGLHKFQKEHGMMITNHIDDYIAYKILNY